MLGGQLERHQAKCRLVSTGWSGGGVGVESRIKLRYTREMIGAALAGKLDEVEFEHDPAFGLSIPKSCPDIASEILSPRKSRSDKDAYGGKASHVGRLFADNFKKLADASPNVAQAGPRSIVGV